MLTVSPTKRKTATAEELADLKAACKRHGITHDAIAAAAGVTRPLVVNVLAARDRSRNVVETASRLVAEAKAALKLARARKRNGDAA